MRHTNRKPTRRTGGSPEVAHVHSDSAAPEFTVSVEPDPIVSHMAVAVSSMAAPSPAHPSDLNPLDAPVAEIDEGPLKMATMAPPAEAAEQAQAMFGDVQGRMKGAFDRSTRIGEEMLDFARGNVEAMMASARVVARAGEVIGTEAADYSRKSVESVTQAFKGFASVKSPTELFQLQGEFAKASFDSAVAEASKLSETMMKLAGEMVQPLSNRYALAAEKIKTVVA